MALATHAEFDANVGAFGESNLAYRVLKMVHDEMCVGCGGLIYDRFLLQIEDGQSWHSQCLRCSLCGLLLEQQPSCYMKEEQVYCKPCYVRQFSAKCARCCRQIQAQDWVRRAHHFVYHLACFACDSCKRQLSTGEEFALQDSRVLCKIHYMELLEGDTQKSNHKQKSKRVRTTFTEEQLHVLQTNFQIDSNPDGQDLERIAQMTGLSKRVTQVWFQNSRARQKKYQGQKEKRGNRQSKSTSPADYSGDNDDSSIDSCDEFLGSADNLDYSIPDSTTGGTLGIDDNSLSVCYAASPGISLTGE